MERCNLHFDGTRTARRSSANELGGRDVHQSEGPYGRRMRLTCTSRHFRAKITDMYATSCGSECHVAALDNVRRSYNSDTSYRATFVNVSAKLSPFQNVVNFSARSWRSATAYFVSSPLRVYLSKLSESSGVGTRLSSCYCFKRFCPRRCRVVCPARVGCLQHATSLQRPTSCRPPPEPVPVGVAWLPSAFEPTHAHRPRARAPAPLVGAECRRYSKRKRST